MAAIAVAPINGAVPSPQPESPQSSASATKRKRDVSDDGSPDANGAEDVKPLVVDAPVFVRDEKRLVRDFFDVLQSFDVEPPILKRPIPEQSVEGEPQAKRQKSDENTKPLTIAEKVSQDAYSILDDLVLDINEVTKDQIAELERDVAQENGATKADSIAGVTGFREKAHELFRREAKYPKAGSQGSKESRDAVQSGADGGLVLTVFGNAPHGKHLFSSLEHPRLTDRSAKPLQEIALPNGLLTTKVIPAGPSEKSTRTLTLGELFPSPRGLPPLQPPKPPKSSMKGNTLGFYHPELTEKSKYRTGSYFSANVSTGQWLDYSNATPTMPTKTKQRERAQSLAGHKPSTTELEMSEMEALFRGAFSSFAPSKDDSAAMVSSGQMSRMWWQRVGQRNFQKMVEAEVPTEEVEEPVSTSTAVVPIDEQAIEEAIENWDDIMIDPSLEDAMGHKSEHDKDVDEVLLEVSDLIETLASYQRNRNLTLPTSQDRYSADPVNGDMLRNGSLAQQPSEEEMATYEVLKAQLALIIKTLPPYAVARLNSDKLDELNVSTKIEIRTEEYKGVMEEDEQAARARQAAAQAAANARPQPQRTPSVSSVPYSNHQYGAPQYGTPSRTPMANPQYYGQTPGRAQPPPPSHQRPPVGPAAPYTQQRPPQAQPFRPNGYTGYAPQMAKPQVPYSHPNMAYSGTPTQPPRMAPHPGYGQPQPPQAPGTPQNRFPPGYPGQYGQHQQGMPGQHTPQQPQYGSPHVNGAPHMQQRPMPPQGPGAPPQHYSQSPQPQQGRPPYGTPQGMPPTQPPPRQYGAGSPGIPTAGLTGYHTVMPEVQQQRLMEQARARASAHERTIGFNEKMSQGVAGGPGNPGAGMGQVAGLAGIGLGTGNVDMAKLAAARANMPGGIGHSPSPKAQMAPMAGPSPGPGSNGIAPPPSASPASLPPSSVSPAPGGPFPRPPA